MKDRALPEVPVRVVVFAKAPVPGEVKTRLAALLGPDGAAALHAGLVRRALATAAQAAIGPVELWCAPDASHSFFEKCAVDFGVALHEQHGDDLGARMEHALSPLPAVVIGSDCPVLGVEDLRQAARALLAHDAAIAPAEDGGYVLIGLSRAHPRLFEGIAWGTAAVMGQTRERLAENRIAWEELPTRWDIDRPEDYQRLQREGRLEEVLS